MRFSGFVGSAYQAQSKWADAQTLYNWYHEKIGEESEYAKAQRGLFPAPGFRLFAAPPPAEGRGIFSQNDRSFVVVGDQLLEVFPDRSWTVRPLTTLLDFPAAPTVTPSPPIPALVQPNPPTVQQGGALGSTAYGYKIVTRNAIGASVASLEGRISTGAAVLDANNFNHITWDEASIVGATSVDIYRTTGGVAPPKFLGNVADPARRYFQDTGIAGVAQVPPIVDTSAQAVGAMTWGYKIVARIGLGKTAASAEGSTAIGFAVLTAVNTNIIKWAAVANAQSYEVWRVTGPIVGSPTLIGETDGETLTFTDTAQVGEIGVPSPVNTTLTQRLVNDGSLVSFASSGDAGQQIIVGATGKAYVLDLRTNVFALVLEGATFVDYVDTYFVALDASTSTLRVSEPLNGFSWPEDVKAQRTIGGDKWLSMAVINNEIWLTGSQTTEVWVGTDADFPFKPYDPVFIQRGIGAAFSMTRVDTSLFFLQQDLSGGGIVVRTDGYGIRRVSHHGLEAALRKYPMISDAEGWTYQEVGHTFYVLSFPTAGATWVYDTAENEWHQRATWLPKAEDFSVYRPRAHAWCFSGVSAGYHLVVDRLTGAIYEMTSEVGTDMDGLPIVRERTAPYISNNGKLVTHHALRIEMEQGVGLSSGQGSQPTAMLTWSDDGETWSDEYWEFAGRQGDRGRETAFYQLGSARDRLYRLRVSDPNPWRIFGAQIDLTAGAF